jgi:TonB family protein
MSGIALELSSIWTGVLTHLWQTSLFIGLMWAVERAMGRAPGRWLERLWQLALLRLLLPGGLSLPGFVLTPWQPNETAKLVWTLPEQVVQTAAVPTVSSIFLPAISGLWLLGVLVHLFRMRQDLRNLNRWRGLPLHKMHQADQRVLMTQMQNLDLKAQHIRWTEKSVMPMVVGLRCPKIVLPLSVIRQLGPDQLRAVLSHENSHRRRRDPLRLLAYSLVQAVFFFHPLWPLVLKRLKDCSEFIADESSLASGLSGRRYALALASTLELKTLRLSAAAGLKNQTSLASRISRFNLKERKVQMLRYQLLLCLALGFLILGMMIPVGNQALALAGSEPDSTATRIESGRPEAEDEAVQPKITFWAKPDYPQECRKAGISGKVHVKILVDAEGNVEKAEVLEGPECLRESALSAAGKCRFKPGMQRGIPVKAWVAIPYEYRLE